MSNQVSVNIKKVLTRMKELLDDPKHWVQGRLYGKHVTRSGINGEPYVDIEYTSVDDSTADCYCMYGAANKALYEMYPELATRIKVYPYVVSLDVMRPVAECVVKQLYQDKFPADDIDRYVRDTGVGNIVVTFNDTRNGTVTHKEVMQSITCAIEKVDDDAMATIIYNERGGSK